MSYISLGRKKVTATADTTGLNTGNWTNAYTHAVLGAKVAYFECHHMAVTQLSGIATLTTYVVNDVWSSVVLGGNSEWDPSQPLLLRPDDEVFLCWSLPATGTPPVSYLWLRYDPAIQPSTGG